MKCIITSFVFGFVFFLVFLFGFGFGVSVRFLPPSSKPTSDRKELKCTCVPCLPDLYCLKCGHKSRDCPKLAHIFRKGTNSVNAASSPVK